MITCQENYKHIRNSTLLFVLIYCSALFGQAQNIGAAIMFDKTIHDFGDIKEANGSVGCNFEFTNNGTSELIIQDVLTSCGCTTPEWTQPPVNPGEKGFVRAVFDPQKRPGAFHKSLTIISNVNAQHIDIIIQGNVIPIDRTIEEQYPIEMGGIRVKYSIISFEIITNEKPVSKSISLYNDMNKSLSFDDEIKAPGHIKVKFPLKPIPPKSIGTIEVIYDPREIELLGYKSDFIEFETNEWFNSIKKFRVIASIEEYFPMLTAEQLAMAPKLKIENPFFNFGKIKQGESVSNDFVITNTGKEELNIRMTRASCGCTVSRPEKNNLKPGESSVINVTFHSKGKRGDQSEFLLVFSNDPSNPKQKITIKSWVED